MDLDEKFAELKKDVIQWRQQQKEQMEELAQNPNFDRLCHFENWNRFTVGVKLTREEVNCPHCGMLMLLDNWPPNYWGGTSATSEGHTVHEDQGTNKYVCIRCCREIHIWTWRKTEDGIITEREETVYDEPLAVKGGKLLTKHDVWREDYRKEHGEYPREAYG